jgi:hypothetical protein
MGVVAPEAVSLDAPATLAAPPPPAPMADVAAAPAGGASRMAEAPAAVAPRSEAYVPPATMRPGLGTEWGETRVSRIHDVDFDRADSSHPFAVATLHYNDARGVQALAAYHGGSVPRFHDYPVGGGAVIVSVRDEADQPLEAVRLSDRTYVIGEQGQRYEIVIENHSNHRVEAVATVDGLDVMNGRSGNVDNRGYVIEPYQTYRIDGFRQSQSRVAAFRFAKVADSYAAQTGSSRNVGVIGVAFFDERGDAFARWSPTELRLRDTADPFPANDHRYAQPPVVRW